MQRMIKAADTQRNDLPKRISIHGAGSLLPGGTRQKTTPRARSDETFSVIRAGSISVTDSWRSNCDFSAGSLRSGKDPAYIQMYNCEPWFEVSDSRIRSSSALSIVYVELRISPSCSGPGCGPLILRTSEAVVGHPEGSPPTVTVALNPEI